MIESSDYRCRADRLDAIRNQLIDLAAEAADLLAGTGAVRDRARPWLRHLDRATGTETTVTMEDTAEELRAAAAVADGAEREVIGAAVTAEAVTT